MRERFGNIAEVMTVDLGDSDHTRLQAIRKAIKYHISRLPHIGSPVPATWTAVREKLENDPRNTINVQDYLEICTSCEITKQQDALVLSQYFHDIGVFLHFQDDNVLCKTLFLKPNWATNAVYRVLDSDILSKQQGRFSKKDAKKIWCEDEYSLLCDDFLQLIHKFFLSFETKNAGQYIVPEKLPASVPDYRWQDTSNLFMRYKYEVFMPKGLLSHLMVQLHHLLKNHHVVWKRGMVLQKDKALAEVIETYDARAINIRISGENRRDLLAIIMDNLDQINAQYEKMKVEKYIPCQCQVCKKTNTPHFYLYSSLKRRIEMGKADVECDGSFEMLGVQGLLDEVIIEQPHNKKDRFSPDLLEPVPIKLPAEPAKPVRDKIFVSYCHKDKDLLERLQVHFKALGNEGVTVDVWDDTRIKAGDKWLDEIEAGLASAKVAILLVSTDFLASDFIADSELPVLLKAAADEGATILPLILKPCRFSNNKQLGAYQSINDPKKPLSKLSEDEQDEVLMVLVDRIVEVMDL